jgi:ribosomal protein S12 methylthiotransferase
VRNSVPKTKINIISLGCPKNLVDSESLLAQLRCEDVKLVRNADEADAVVINTCGFIRDAKQESIDAILEAVEKKNRGELKKVIVAGCLAERFKRELAEEIPEVDYFFGTDHIRDIVGALGIDYKRNLLGERILMTPPHYAYLKISEGCDHPCSFCAIPLMRGRHRSKPMDDVIGEARRLAESGVKELIVIAQDTTSYGLESSGERQLAGLLSALNEIDGIKWIRLMYAYPAKFPADVLELFRKDTKLCRYLDLPLQHISDSVLKSMRRGIGGRATRTLVERIKTENPDLALRTTFIVGYPHETEKDFDELLDFVQEMKFHRLGVFQYSQEEGTHAFQYGDPLPPEVKAERQARLMEAQKEISEARNEALAGASVEVLIDSREGEFFIGRTQWDAPEIDQEVIIESRSPLAVGSFCSVKITGAAEYDLFASL